MIRSMTGFGRASVDVDGIDLNVEVKSVNHRYLKISTRIPDVLAGAEVALEAEVKSQLQRGAVNLSMHFGSKGGHEARTYSLNHEVIKGYFSELKALSAELGIEAELSIDNIARIQGAVEVKEADALDQETLMASAKKVLKEALAACVASRAEEGASLASDLIRHAEILRDLNSKAEERAPTVVADYRSRLVERIAKLLDGSKVEVREEDIAREVAMFADRSDINEEFQRLGHHIDSLITLVNESQDEAGRRLDFIAQEMLREANTMGSKANDGELSSIVLEMKANIEKIKEQVQNVE